MPKTPRYTAIELVKLLEEKGWAFVSQKGSHRKLSHPDGSCSVVVPMHNRVLAIGLQKSIMKKADLMG